jgi:hypothetical protein
LPLTVDQVPTYHGGGMSSAPAPAGSRGNRGARWRVVLAIGFALAALVLIALWINPQVGAVLNGRPPQSSPAVRNTDAPIIFSGVGSQTTAPFYLTGGTYHGDWSAWGEGAEFPPCTHSAELLAVNPSNGETAGGHVADLASLVSVPATGASAESYVYNLKPGEYFLDVASACSWQIALSPEPS